MNDVHSNYVNNPNVINKFFFCEKLPILCVFCNKETKYLKGSKTREKLSQCMEFRADEKVRNSAKKRNGKKITAICSDELIAKEAVYHKTCYRNYTKVLYEKQFCDESGSGESSISEIALNSVK